MFNNSPTKAVVAEILPPFFKYSKVSNNATSLIFFFSVSKILSISSILLYFFVSSKALKTNNRWPIVTFLLSIT